MSDAKDLYEGKPEPIDWAKGMAAWLRNTEPLMDLLGVPNRGSERFEARSVLLDLASLIERGDVQITISDEPKPCPTCGGSGVR